MNNIVTMHELAQGLYYNRQRKYLYITLRQLSYYQVRNCNVYLPFSITNEEYRNHHGVYIPSQPIVCRMPLCIQKDHSWNAYEKYKVKRYR